MAPPRGTNASPFMLLGGRDLRYVAQAGVCVFIKQSAPGRVRPLAVAASADIARSAIMREPGFAAALRLRPDEAVVILEACPARRARLAAAVDLALRLRASGPAPLPQGAVEPPAPRRL